MISSLKPTTAAVACLFCIGIQGVSAAEITAPSAARDNLQMRPPAGAVAKVPDISVKLPDLALKLQKNNEQSYYPIGVLVKNVGTAASSETTFRLTCDEMAGSSVIKNCLSKIQEPVPALEPGKAIWLELPYAPFLQCRQNPDPPKITACILTGVIENQPFNQPNDSQKIVFQPTGVKGQ